MRMSEDTVRVVQRFLREALMKEPVRKFHAWDWREVERFVHGVRTSVALPEVEDDELHVVVALCLVGPRQADIPQTALRDDILEKLRRFVPQPKTRVERAFDVVVVYGCGIWRTVEAGSGSWAQRWQPALDQLSASILAWMRATAAWLQLDIQLRGYAFTAPFPTWTEAEALAFLFWSGQCDCFRLKAEDSDAPLDRHAAQRAARCMREHRLQAWNPAHLGLNTFIACAVKGRKAESDDSGRKGFVSGAVEQGIFFCDLYRYHDVRFGKVLGWQCPSHPDVPFEGERCFLCAEEHAPVVFSAEQHTRTIVRRLLVKAPTGPYEEAEYWHCQDKNCSTYYREYLSSCPLCRQPRGRGAARSSVWVLGTFTRLGPGDTNEQGELWKIFRQLEPLEQKVVQLIILEGLPRQEAAKRLSLSLEEVTRLHTIALTQLKEMLQ